MGFSEKYNHFIQDSNGFGYDYIKMLHFTVYTDADLCSPSSFVRAGTHFAALSNWCTRVRAHSLTHPHTRTHTDITDLKLINNIHTR